MGMRDPVKRRAYRERLIEQLLEGGFTPEEIQHLSPDDLFDTWCDWEGLVSYSHKLKDVMSAIFDVELPGA